MKRSELRCSKKASHWQDSKWQRAVLKVSSNKTPVTQITPEEVRQFLLTKYADSIHGIGLIPAEIGDDFDFLLSGVIDSFGVLEMISSIEDQFRIRLDMATLDAEQITIVGPLSVYVAQHARPAERE